jgi:hypothetical protein
LRSCRQVVEPSISCYAEQFDRADIGLHELSGAQGSTFVDADAPNRVVSGADIYEQNASAIAAPYGPALVSANVQDIFTGAIDRKCKMRRVGPFSIE